MRSLAVLSPSLFSKLDDNKKCLLNIANIKVPIGFVEDVTELKMAKSNIGPNQVLVKKKSFSLNYRDKNSIYKAWLFLKDWPKDDYYPIGAEFCGVVVQVGNEVKGFNTGDKVIANGYYYSENEINSLHGLPSDNASLEFEKFHFSKLIKIDQSISSEIGACITIGTQTANALLRKASPKEGSKILITGITSNTSLNLLNYINHNNVEIYGVSYSQKNIHNLLSYFPFIKRIYTFNDVMDLDIKFDIVFDVFAELYFPKVLKLLNFNAKYLTCGIYNQINLDSYPDNTNLGVLLRELIVRNISMMGNCLGSSEDLFRGINQVVNNKKEVLIDSVVTSESDVEKFVKRSFNINYNKFGKVVFSYK